MFSRSRTGSKENEQEERVQDFHAVEDHVPVQRQQRVATRPVALPVKVFGLRYQSCFDPSSTAGRRVHRYGGS
eukprot:8743694-Heterocapsa_arctica.AAC.1